MKRREFVAGVSLLMGASMIARGASTAGAKGLPEFDRQAEARAARVSEESRARRIDVHQHGIPGAYAAALRVRGMHSFAGRALPDWSVEQTLAVMDAKCVAVATCTGRMVGAGGRRWRSAVGAPVQ